MSTIATERLGYRVEGAGSRGVVLPGSSPQNSSLKPDAVSGLLPAPNTRTPHTRPVPALRAHPRSAAVPSPPPARAHLLVPAAP